MPSRTYEHEQDLAVAGDRHSASAPPLYLPPPEGLDAPGVRRSPSMGGLKGDSVRRSSTRGRQAIHYAYGAAPACARDRGSGRRMTVDRCLSSRGTSIIHPGSDDTCVYELAGGSAGELAHGGLLYGAVLRERSQWGTVRRMNAVMSK
jgi:hypothetical protein